MADDARAAAQQRARGALAAAGAGAWSWDAVTQAYTWDERCDTLYGCSADAPRHLQAWLGAVHPEDRPRVQARLNRLLATPGDDEWNVEYRAVRGNGDTVWTQSVGRAERDGAGRVLRVSGIDLDISLRKRAEADLQAAREALGRRSRLRTAALRERGEQLSRLASELTLAEQHERQRLAAVLHDELQQFLVGAKLSVERLQAGADDGGRDAAAQRLAELVSRAIEISRTLIAELSPAVLQEPGLLEGLQWLARWMRETHGLEVVLDVDPSCVIEREDVRLLVYQCIRESLFNVVKHAGVRRAHVDARWADDEHLRIHVRDTGAGFDLSGLPPPAGGVRFGLASIRERLALLGGRFEVDTAPGDGTRISLLVPVDGVLRSRPAPLNDGTQASGSAAAPVRVLVADGRTIARKALAALLAAHSDLRVVGEASSGNEAIALVRLLQPDAMLLCLTMRGLGGVQTARRLSREHPALRIVGVVDGAQPADRDAMLRAGAVAVATVDGSVEGLLRAIRGA